LILLSFIKEKNKIYFNIFDTIMLFENIGILFVLKIYNKLNRFSSINE